MVQQAVQRGAPAAYAQEMERLTAKESLLLASVVFEFESWTFYLSCSDLQSMQRGDPSWVGYIYAFLIFSGVPYVDWFKWDGAKHPLSNAPEPKRCFTRSKSEDKMVVRYCRAIRKGLIKFDEPKEEPSVYLLWGDESNSNEKSGHLAYIPAPKPKLPGHEESYNPSKEYIPTQEEINAYHFVYVLTFCLIY
ncbi:ribosome biogenesis protein BOP1 homolog [Humulus lupulus]|uniref:ribosome biogenesis protein BOP1 homolog n=1 Tax=Humulus lupulus TaxID=3486 RepID=UPI002B416AB9|nr:ribosome biogenesis protein BOP1 homolog [Humulus lupulus]